MMRHLLLRQPEPADETFVTFSAALDKEMNETVELLPGAKCDKSCERFAAQNWARQLVKAVP